MWKFGTEAATFRRTGFGPTEGYREYSAGFSEAKGPKSSRHWAVQLFFHKLARRRLLSD